MINENTINKIANSLANSKIDVGAYKEEGKDFHINAYGDPLEVFVSYLLIGLYIKDKITFSEEDLEICQRVAKHIYTYADKQYKEKE